MGRGPAGVTSTPGAVCVWGGRLKDLGDWFPRGPFRNPLPQRHGRVSDPTPLGPRWPVGLGECRGEKGKAVSSALWSGPSRRQAYMPSGPRRFWALELAVWSPSCPLAPLLLPGGCPCLTWGGTTFPGSLGSPGPYPSLSFQASRHPCRSTHASCCTHALCFSPLRPLAQCAHPGCLPKLATVVSPTCAKVPAVARSVAWRAQGSDTTSPSTT